MYKGNCHLLLKPDIKEFLHTHTKKNEYCSYSKTLFKIYFPNKG